jgi:hypothetical protein
VLSKGSHVAEIIQLRERTPRAKRGKLLVEWALGVGHRVSPLVTLAGLPERLLGQLAESDPKGTSLLEELVLLLALGKRGPVTHLPPKERMRILDLSLFFLDQVRFECMTRLGWIEPLPSREIPLVEILVLDPANLRELRGSPRLRQDHPHFHRFENLPLLDRETFLRKLIPQALELFRRRLDENP